MLFLSAAALVHAEGQTSDRVFTESALSIKMSNLAGFIGSYSDHHQGNLPASWKELDDDYSLSHLDTSGGGPIPDNFVLLPDAPVSRELNNEEIKRAQVLAIGRASVTELNREGLGRFVIYKTSTGRFLASWFPEDKVRRIIMETRAIVPPPPAVQRVNPYDQQPTK